MANILIVDDEQPIRRVLSEILEAKDYICVQAADAAEARKYLEGQDFDLVLSDINMPGESGLDFVRYVLSAYPRTTAVMVSVIDDQTIAEDALEIGIYDYIVKPFERNEVLFSVANVLRRRELEIENRNYRNDLEGLVAARTDALEKTVAQLEMAHEALQKSEADYRELVQNANSIILRYDAQGRINFFNEFAQEFFGYTPDEVLHQKLVGTIVPKTDSSGRDLEAMIQDIIRNPERYKNYENENIKSKGERVWVAWTNKAIFDHDGHIKEILAIGNDITERKRAEESRILLATAIKHASESVMITDADGNILYVNPAFEKITGYRKKELIGNNSKILQSGKHDQAFYKSMWSTLTHGRIWTGHLINKKKDGSLYEEDATISPVKNSAGEITNYVAVKRDVTDEIRKETQLRQAQKMEAIGTLAGGIAHDFNNILTAIIGFSEISKEQVPKGSPVAANLDEVFKAGLRARDLVEQILAFSRQSEQDRKPIQIRPLVKEALKLLRASLPTTIEIRNDLSPEGGVIEADTTQIHQVLMNLCTNAGHAMREAGGILKINLAPVEIDADAAAQNPDLHPGSYLRMTVSDTGCGMPPEVLDRIFDPYFTTKKKGEGTGLGLAVVHGIVKSHGGAITVYSEPGKGSTFQVYFPEIAAAKAEQGAEMQPFQSLPTGHESILFVDDEQVLAKLGKQMTEGLGYEVASRTASREALELFRSQPDRFDLVITDMTMPAMTGTELAREILRIRPDIPIILCTGFSENITEQRINEIGIREFLPKPILIPELAKTIRKALDEQN